MTHLQLSIPICRHFFTHSKACHRAHRSADSFPCFANRANSASPLSYVPPRFTVSPPVTRNSLHDDTYLMVSSSSHPTGIPISLISLNSSLAILNPLLIWKLPSISGSLISPFHPTVVLGFSKYALMTISNPGHRPSCTPARSLWAYSFAWSISWMEHGPTMTSKRFKGSVWETMEAHVRREELIVLVAMGVTGRSCLSNAGGMRGSY